MPKPAKRFGSACSIGPRWAATILSLFLTLAFGPAAAQTADGDTLFDYPETALEGTPGERSTLSLDACRRLCSADAGCAGFDHSPRNFTCRIFSTVTASRPHPYSVAGTRAPLDGRAEPVPEHAPDDAITSDPAPETECDRLAADPDDAGKLASVQGLYRIVQPDRSLAACRRAVADYPNEPRLQFQLGRAYAASYDFDRARIHYGIAADAGYGAGYCGLGFLTLSVEDGNAIELLKAAAEKNERCGVSFLAYSNLFGIGLNTNKEEAYKLYQQCADMGSATCYYRLGYMTLYTFRQRNDISFPMKMFKIAADKGHPEGFYELVLSHAFFPGIYNDHRLAAKYMIRAFQTGLGEEKYFGVTQEYPDAFTRELQAELKALGVYDGQIDGKFGPAMRRAMMAIHGADFR